jgi:hypothetical protein
MRKRSKSKTCVIISVTHRIPIQPGSVQGVELNLYCRKRRHDPVKVFLKTFRKLLKVMAVFRLALTHVRSPHLRTPNPGFNPGFTPPLLYNKCGV